MTLAEALALNHTLIIEAAEEGGFFCYFPDLPGCMTQGETYEEAFAMAMDARQLWIETGIEHGIDIPTPRFPPDLAAINAELQDAAEADRHSGHDPQWSPGGLW